MRARPAQGEWDPWQDIPQKVGWPVALNPGDGRAARTITHPNTQIGKIPLATLPTAREPTKPFTSIWKEMISPSEARGALTMCPQPAGQEDRKISKVLPSAGWESGYRDGRWRHTSWQRGLLETAVSSSPFPLDEAMETCPGAQKHWHWQDAQGPVQPSQSSPLPHPQGRLAPRNWDTPCPPICQTPVPLRGHLFTSTFWVWWIFDQNIHQNGWWIFKNFLKCFVNMSSSPRNWLMEYELTFLSLHFGFRVGEGGRHHPHERSLSLGVKSPLPPITPQFKSQHCHLLARWLGKWLLSVPQLLHR